MGAGAAGAACVPISRAPCTCDGLPVSSCVTCGREKNTAPPISRIRVRARPKQPCRLRAPAPARRAGAGVWCAAGVVRRNVQAAVLEWIVESRNRKLTSEG